MIGYVDIDMENGESTDPKQNCRSIKPGPEIFEKQERLDKVDFKNAQRVQSSQCASLAESLSPEGPKSWIFDQLLYHEIRGKQEQSTLNIAKNQGVCKGLG